jgi:DNA-directed RNA polymerase specialized sigma24 family protein
VLKRSKELPEKTVGDGDQRLVRRAREITVTRHRWFGKTVSRGRECGSEEEFARVFESERVGLQRLALLLTANSEAAKQCLSRAFQECVAGGSVSKEWVLSWTRRMVVRTAISLVMGRGSRSFVDMNSADSRLFAFTPDDSLGINSASEPILDLLECERFVFVICVLERYSIHDCALLLGKSPREVNELRHRVCNRVRQIDEPSWSLTTFPNLLEEPVRSGGAE